MQYKMQRLVTWTVKLMLVATLLLTRAVFPVAAQERAITPYPEVPIANWVANSEDQDIYASGEPEENEAAMARTNQVYLPFVSADLPLETSVVATAVRTLLVTKVADTNDHVCNTDCSLREAAEATATTAEVDVITLPTGVYKLALGPIALGSTEVRGAGASNSIIDGQQRSGVITIRGGAVTLQKLTIRNGKGPGIYQDIGSLTVADSVITANQAASTCGGGISSVVDNAKELTIRNSQITNNRAQDGGGICLNELGASILNSTIDGNQVLGRGGGIYVNEGSFNLSNSTISNNRAGSSGGGVYLHAANGTLENSAVLKNQAQDGGGLWSGYDTGLFIRNTTISGNSARNNGGGIHNAPEADLTLEQVTLAFNVADSDNQDGGDGGGLFSMHGYYGIVTLRHTLIGKNSDKSGQAPDCAGPVVSDTYNLLQNAKGCVLSGNLQDNLTGVDPQLGPLDFHGGITQNHLPLTTSAAIDAIPVASCTLALDQRGVARPQDGNNDGNARCDIGATERKPSAG